MSGPASPPEPYSNQSATLTVRLLGDFALTYGGDPVTTIKTPRLQSLFAYLLLHRQATHARRRLAFLLWPDSSEAQALTNLRKQLLYLQQALPAPDSLLHIERGSIQLRPDADIRLDVEEFECALSQAACAKGDQARLALVNAVTHYQGELFPGCYDEWIFPLRERLHGQFVYGLECLVHLCEEQQLYGVAIEYVQRLLQQDTLRESSYRHLMRLYALNGERALALRAYHTCVTQLKEELGVEPDEETQAAYERLLHHQPVEEAVRTVAASAPLIGRQPEWQTLQQQWRRAVQGEARFILLTGEAGIGKTRLAEELLDWAWRQGIATARTRSYAAEGRLAYAPVVEWLRSDAFASKLQQVETAWLPELTRLLPELAANESIVTPTPPSHTWQPQSWQRHRLFEALVQALLVGPEPRLLVIDDLQWCDQETLEWLRYFMRYAHTARLLIIGTMRPEEVTGDHPLVTFIHEIRTAGQLTEITLEALTVEETTKLAEHLTATALDAATVAQLYAATEGHPLFVVEMVRAQGETALGQVANSHNRGWLTAEESAPPTLTALPPKIHGVIAARLSRLSPAARRVATLAAVIGRAFSFAVLRAAVNGSEEALVDALDELWQRRIIREQGSSGYDFSHDKIREVIYTEISIARRRLLHHRVAEALETLFTDQLDGVATQVAAHFEQAGMVQRAIVFYQMAAKIAVRVYAYREAISQLQRALTLLATLPKGRARDEQEFTLLLAIGPPLIAVNEFASVQVGEIYLRAHILSQQLSYPPDPAVLRTLAIHHLGYRRFEQVFAWGVQVLELATKQPGEIDPVLYVEGNYVLGVTLFWQGRFARAQEHLQQAVNVYDVQRHDVHTTIYAQDTGIYCGVRLAWTLWYLGYPDQARERCEEAIALAQALAHPFSLQMVLTFAVSLFLDCRDVHVAASGIGLLQTLYHKRQLQTMPAFGQVLQGWYLVQTGQIQAGIRQICSGIALRKNMTSDLMYRPHDLGVLAEAYRLAGAYNEGLAALDEAFTMLKDCQEYWYMSELCRIQGELLASQGRTDIEVENCFCRALSIARCQNAKSLELRAAMSLGRLWLRQGRREQARQLLADVYNWFTDGFDTPDLKETKALLDTLSFSAVILAKPSGR